MRLTMSLANVRNGAAFRCLEAVGQAIAYGMNTKTSTSPLVGMLVLPFPPPPLTPDSY